MKHLLALFGMAIVLATGGVSAQDNKRTSIVLSPDKEYAIGPSDVLEVYILRMPELSRDYRVSGDGTIELPFLGKLRAQQRTSSELAKLIADGLRGDYLVDPQVSVLVKQVNRQFFIQGSVRTPGVYNIEGHPSLLELITIAGGLNPTFGTTAFIIRSTKPGDLPLATDDEEVKSEVRPSYVLTKADITALLRGDFSENRILEPNDIVHIPAADVFFVAGEVNAPGSFPLTQGTTLRQAISVARGTTRTASPGKAVIFREDKAGKKSEIPVDVDAVMRGKRDDIAIAANDIIVIPNSKAKSVFLPVVNAFGAGAAMLPIQVIR